MSVSNLIEQLHHLINTHSSVINIIRYPHLLIRALQELNELVEMKEAKEALVQQIQFLLVNGDFDHHMLHTVIYGPPGTGKTQLGLIIARIWMALGLINRPKVEQLPPEHKKERLEIGNLILKTRLQKIYNEAIEIKSQIEKQRNALHQIKPLRKPGKPNDIAQYKEWDIIALTERKIQILCNDIIRDCSIIPHSEVMRARTSSLPQKPILTSEEPGEIPITIVSREDMVKGYVGQTGLATLKLLQDNIGKVIFIDEAYSLINGDHDSFGMDALTCLNKFMSEHSHEIIIIFAGYKEKMQETIFKAQPGLQRRCNWTFEIEGYSASALAEIFKKQLKRRGWNIEETIDLIEFFEQNMDKFPAYGGDTERLAFQCKLAYTSLKFGEICEDKTSKEDLNYVIDREILTRALERLEINQVAKKEENSRAIPEGMYG